MSDEHEIVGRDEFNEVRDLSYNTAKAVEGMVPVVTRTALTVDKLSETVANISQEVVKQSVPSGFSPSFLIMAFLSMIGTVATVVVPIMSIAGVLIYQHVGGVAAPIIGEVSINDEEIKDLKRRLEHHSELEAHPGGRAKIASLEQAIEVKFKELANTLAETNRVSEKHTALLAKNLRMEISFIRSEIERLNAGPPIVNSRLAVIEAELNRTGRQNDETR